MSTAEENGLKFMKSISQDISGPFHTVRRDGIFEDVMALHSKEDVLTEFPLRIKFAGEVAVDLGGVCREMFAAFWEEAYKLYFDGSTLLSPVLHPHIDMQSLPKLSVILSHGYLCSGFLPTRIVLPVLVYILLGTTVELPSSILVNAFADSLSSHEASRLKEALGVQGREFSEELKGSLISILSRFGCRVIPTPQNFQSQIVQIAKYEFHVKPMAALYAINSGIPHCELTFWQSHTIEQVSSLYYTLMATSSKVLAMLQEPVESNSSQCRVFNYLQQFIGNMNQAEVRRILRFTTGSSVMVSGGITVTFNNLSGIACRPIAHTCDCCLELPSAYTSYLEFEQEFNAVLADDNYAWKMDSI